MLDIFTFYIYYLHNLALSTSHQNTNTLTFTHSYSTFACFQTISRGASSHDIMQLPTVVFPRRHASKHIPTYVYYIHTCSVGMNNAVYQRLIKCAHYVVLAIFLSYSMMSITVQLHRTQNIMLLHAFRLCCANTRLVR